MSRKKDYFEGYMTVEATFIVSFALMIITMLLYWGFYCYDKSVSIQCSYLAALRGSGKWNMTNTELEKYVSQQIEELTKESVLYCDMEEYSTTVDLLTIQTEMNGGVDILFSGIREEDIERLDMSSKKSAYRLKPSSYIRKYYFLGE